MKHFRRVISVVALVTLLMAIAGSGWAAESARVNINTATVDELVQLQRIGPSFAAKIVEYREAVGPFEKPEDIMNVPGIGPKAYEANKDRIVVK